MSSQRDLLRQILNAIAVFAAFGVNILANVRPLRGLTLGEISNQVFGEVLITPANYAFAIWGLIYLGLFSFAIYQALPAQRSQPLFRRLGYWLVVASVAQIAWVFLFQLGFFGWSFLAMVVILFPLMQIYTKLDGLKLGKRERWFVKFPLTIYFAWISVATIVNGGVSLTHWEWAGWGISPEVWTVIMMIIGGAIALWIAWTRGDIPFIGVFIWALSAISIRHLDNPLIAATGFLLSLILAVTTILSRKIYQ
ncbi:tryptophan-rich sensory protein [Euhalothece natronophila Z-M001]|uniref:Tryptophan-rich sensory protein n=1 Tax=Euhalothece natronophila Z-M001 TaxID=522448 RepID=A0A5B8NT14_9CHRO|nr:tryptophan-rich sensory protein [Euhalothece natronophila]QDZ41475.1 tryptophan-rich sensory protein [Euhalothece natronophila Z-M001]